MLLGNGLDYSDQDKTRAIIVALSLPALFLYRWWRSQCSVMYSKMEGHYLPWILETAKEMIFLPDFIANFFYEYSHPFCVLHVIMAHLNCLWLLANFSRFRLAIRPIGMTTGDPYQAGSYIHLWPIVCGAVLLVFNPYEYSLLYFYIHTSGVVKFLVTGEL